MERQMIKTGRVVGIVFNTVLTFSLCVGLIMSMRNDLNPGALHALLALYAVLTGINGGINIVNSEEEEEEVK